MRFLDANVILRYLTRDDEAKAQACYELFQRVRFYRQRSGNRSTPAVIARCHDGWSRRNRSSSSTV